MIVVVGIAAVAAHAATQWESFADGSVGRVTEYQGVGGTPIPAYIRKPAGEGPFPVVVMQHGNVSSKEDTYAMGRSTRHPTEDFIAAGWAVYSFDFRPNPPLKFDPREWDDASAAIEAVRRVSFIDGKKVAVLGGSHGATTFSRMISRTVVSCAVLCSPAAVDLIEVNRAIGRGEIVNPQLPKLITMLEERSGANIDDIARNPEKYGYASALTEAAGVHCPELLINGRNDWASPISVVNAYVVKLRAAGAHVETWFPDYGPHGFYFGSPREIGETAEAARKAVDFIRTYFNAGGSSFDQLRRLYDYDPKAPLDIRETTVQQQQGVQIHEITYVSPMGGRVPASVLVPPGKGPFAGIIFMHGGVSNRGSVLKQALMFSRTGAVCLTLDSPLNGARALPGEILLTYAKPERTRDAFIQTVVDMRRGVDLLLARPDVDPHRLAYVGASFGALVGGVFSGVEHRIKAYVFPSGLDSVNHAIINSVQEPMKTLPALELARCRAIIDTVSPVYYVGHSAPAALFLQNGLKDTGIPRDSALRWQQAASEPKLIKRYDGGHGLNNQATLDRAEWLRKQIGIAALAPADLQKLQAHQ
jgi:dienelactone hydrolase